MSPAKSAAAERFALLDTVAMARRYLQQEYAQGWAAFSHPGDKACTVEHWKRVVRRIPDWTDAPSIPA